MRYLYFSKSFLRDQAKEWLQRNGLYLLVIYT